MRRIQIHIRGIVQGVGMRPFVYREAVAAGVGGWVLNAGDGVHIEAEGDDAALDTFLRALRDRAPAAARIDGIEVRQVDAGDGAPEDGRPAVPGFRIVASDDTTARTTLVSPDIATCPDCLRELFDPEDRRYHYPFINCTNCGPRFTIIRALPYDRPATSMSAFPMCPDCAREYADPLDRRFHAQPDACFACGPHITWHERGMSDARTGSTREASDAIIERCAELIAAGGIVAVKGLGGFHLACDAGNDQAVRELRTRKRRPRKPFAVMMASLADVEGMCTARDAERELLQGSVRPIVLVRHVAGCAPSVAFDLPELGVMLPYTPLQHLLLAACARRGVRALVMTSGNVSGEPIETDDARAWERLVEGGIADALLGNDRSILARYDDSVARVDARGAARLVRRARGYAPQPLTLPTCGDDALPTILVCGAEQKATLALTREQADGAALCFLSQHIGDVEHASSLAAWHEARERMEGLFDLAPRALACDRHPTYLTARWARDEAQRLGVPLIEVQHHHAHIAAAIAEAAAYDGLDAREPVVGIAFDGTGAGTDGTVWGGEFLVATLTGFERAAHLATMPLPGGAAAIRDPRRCAYALLWQHNLLGHPGAARLLDSLGGGAASIMDTMLERGINSPLTSSMGRFLDACAALLGICERASYDGEPAIELEAAAVRAADAGAGQEFRDASRKLVAKFRYARCGTASEAVRSDGEDGRPEKPQDSCDRDRASVRSERPNAGSGVAESCISEFHHHILPPEEKNLVARHGGTPLAPVIIDPSPLLTALLDGIAAGEAAEVLALQVHDALARMAAEVAGAIARARGIDTVALGGGVFMNRLLLEQTRGLLEAESLQVIVPQRIPINDGGIAYGQAAVARARLAARLDGTSV